MVLIIKRNKPEARLQSIVGRFEGKIQKFVPQSEPDTFKAFFVEGSNTLIIKETLKQLGFEILDST